MHCLSLRPLALALGLFAALGGSLAAAVPPSENLLPNSTKGYFAIPSVPKLVASWERTQLHQLLADPVMKPFTEDLHRQLDQKWFKSHEKIGLSFDDLRGIAAGELAVAMVGTTQGQTALAVLVDVTGQEQRAQDVLKKAAENLTKEGAKRSQRKLAGVDVTVYELALKDDPKKVRTVAYFLKDGLLCGTDDMAVAADVLKRWDGKQPDNLSTLSPYQSVMGRCQKAAGELQPDVRWFVNPLGFAEAMRVGDEKKIEDAQNAAEPGLRRDSRVGRLRELRHRPIRNPPSHRGLRAAAL